VIKLLRGSSTARVVAIFMVLAALITSVMPTSAQTDRLCFNVPGITNCIEGRFREYWAQNGGLPVFGYPISAPTQQSTSEGTFLTQYFERNTFELHPEKPRPYDVLLGRLGDSLLRGQGTVWQNLPKAAPTAPHFFPETGHAVSHEPFWQYWSGRGLQDPTLNPYQRSLALFGLPISEAFTATNPNGDTVLMQWFERARFEWHPNKPQQFQVLLGLLGNELRTAPVTPPPATPTPTPRPQAGITVTTPKANDFVRAPFRLQGRVDRYPNDGLLYYRLTTDDGDELAENWFDVRRTDNGATYDTLVRFKEPGDFEALTLEVTERADDGTRLLRTVVGLRFDPEELGRQEIVVDAPEANAEVRSPLRVRGRTLRFPTGGTLNYRLRSDDGDTVVQGKIGVKRDGAGSTFDTRINFPEPKDEEIFDLILEERNAQGDNLARTIVKVRFEP
jgi:hypothetical protein